MSTIRIRRPWELPERETTPETAYWNRREILTGLGLGALVLSAPGSLACAPGGDPAKKTAPAIGTRFADRFPAKRNELYGPAALGNRKLTPEDQAASFNNFYEFTTDKPRVWELAQGYPVDPWKVEVSGLVKKPLTLGLEDILTRFPLEERLYRFRCVERWAMQVPWTGYPLAKLIDFVEPLPSAAYVKFTCLEDKTGLPGQRLAPYYPWPYFEGLRLDEARHPLAFVAVGIYGHGLPMQHGAPWRLAIPWKYGYKGPKSIVKIELTAEQPHTFWHDLQPSEYGFFSNVDPGKPHPRWSQARETDIGTQDERATLLYNGYADQVSSLYTGKET